jgi:6,7-dimethyl-8-ribityllumazine synthase
VAAEPDAHIDAGRVVVGATPHAEPLATRIADQIVRATTRE